MSYLCLALCLIKVSSCCEEREFEDLKRVWDLEGCTKLRDQVSDFSNILGDGVYRCVKKKLAGQEEEKKFVLKVLSLESKDPKDEKTILEEIQEMEARSDFKLPWFPFMYGCSKLVDHDKWHYYVLFEDFDYSPFFLNEGNIYASYESTMQIKCLSISSP